MLYTVTFNPSLDYILEAPSFTLGKVGRTTGAKMTFGGKGISQSVVLTGLGVPNCALGLVGGYTGGKLCALLDEKKVLHDFTPIAGETRINIKLRADLETEINAPGPSIAPDEWEKFLEKLQKLEPGDILSFGGSVPPGIKATSIRDLLLALAGRDVRVAVDADGALLVHSLEGKPWLVKPNQYEAAAVLHLPMDTPDFPRVACEKLRELGARNIILSLGKEGAVLFTEEGQFYSLSAPTGTVKGTTGAGDSLVAGFLAGLWEGRQMLGAFYLGVAAGSATAFAGALANRQQILTVEAAMKMR